MIYVMGIDLEYWIIFIQLVLGLSYLVIGFIVSFEVVLGMGGSPVALRWIKARHSYKNLYVEVMLFYPMILIAYFFLEVLPHYLFKAYLSPFDMDTLFDKLYGNSNP
ncbi:MAG: hypothetical protein U9N52_05770 [Campylobacterota bacterium]|nr:hypothetical protein [Campylobacterota bacterium]